MNRQAATTISVSRVPSFRPKPEQPLSYSSPPPTLSLSLSLLPHTPYLLLLCYCYPPEASTSSVVLTFQPSMVRVCWLLDLRRSNSRSVPSVPPRPSRWLLVLLAFDSSSSCKVKPPLQQFVCLWSSSRNKLFQNTFHPQIVQ